MREDTIPKLFLKNKNLYPDRVAFREKDLGLWKRITWKEYWDHVCFFALGLKSLSLKKRDHIAILGDNCKEWLYADLAAECSSATAIGIYPTDVASQVNYILENSESTFVVTRDQEQVDKVLAVKDELPLLKKIIVIDMKGLGRYDDPILMSFKAVEELGKKVHEKEPHLFEEMVKNTQPDDIGIIVYTSGTTGPPKGSMISQRNVMSMIQGFADAWHFDRSDSFVSALPLCHMAEKSFSLLFPMTAGCMVNFAESISTLQEDLKEISPTFFLTVPRIWEKMHSNMMIKMQNAVFFKRWVYHAMLPIGERVFEYRQKKLRIPLLWRFFHLMAYFALFRPLKNQLGLLQARLFASGGAPLSPDLMRFYYSIGIPIFETYGMTESTAAVFVPRGDKIKIGGVGKPFRGLEVKIAEDGEILIRGDVVFQGYYRDPQASQATMIDGWLLTGDIGDIDEDGDLHITGRKKDIIITAGGKNITPAEIENKLKFSPFINEAVVIGDKRKYLTCLIQIDLENVSHWAQNNQVLYTNYKSLATNPKVFELIQGEVEKANKHFAQVETIKRFTILEKELDPDDEELTATMKVKRMNIEKKLKDIIEAMY